jgi:prophage antirepressor-like protein
MSSTTALVPYPFEGHRIRVSTDEHGEAWFAAADIAGALGQIAIARALANLREEEQCLYSQEGPGSEGCTLALISEGGLLRLLLLLDDSQTAWRMRRWLTHELLPAIQRNQQVKSRAHLSGPAGEKTQIVQAVLRLAEEIIELTGVGYSDALLAAIEDIEASTGLHLAPVQQVLREHDPGYSAHRPGQLGDPPVKARLDAEQLAERLGRTIRDINRRLAACGLQVRNDLDDWQLTAVGRDWGIALPHCSRGEHRQQIVWDPAVVALLQGEG